MSLAAALVSRFLPLHVSHMSWRLLTSFNPPAANGTMWSYSARLIGLREFSRFRPHPQQYPRSRKNTARFAHMGGSTRFRIVSPLLFTVRSLSFSSGTSEL